MCAARSSRRACSRCGAVAPALGRGFSDGGAPLRRPGRGARQRPLLAQPAGRGSRERAVAQAPASETRRADRGSDARLLPLPRSRTWTSGSPPVDAPYAQSRPQHLVHGRGPPAPGRDPGAGAGGSSAVRLGSRSSSPTPTGRSASSFGRSSRTWWAAPAARSGCSSARCRCCC